MRAVEARIVKRKLAMYQDLLVLASEKNKEALMMQMAYEAEAGAKAIRFDPRLGSGSGSGKSRETRLNEILTDQIELDKMAAEYSRQATQIRIFIQSIEDPRKTYLEQAFLQGKRFRDIARDENYSNTAVSKSIMRCLMTVPEANAKTCGLL